MTDERDQASLFPRMEEELDLFDVESLPARQWDHAAVRRALDELFTLVEHYQESPKYLGLMHFVAAFKRYSAFNAMLVHIQKPGATYVLTASKWLERYGRRVMAGAQPLVMLQPKGPVMFAFDVSDTEGPPLPQGVEDPFAVRSGFIGDEYQQTVRNCLRDGVRIREASLGSQQAGSIQKARIPRGTPVPMLKVGDKHQVPLRFELVLNQNHALETKYVTLLHELAHLYCGHIGTPDPGWWPDRRGTPDNVCEFEAESVTYLVAARRGLDSASESYLHGYAETNATVPPISFDRVMRSAMLIEQMGDGDLSVRKPTSKRKSGASS